MPAVTQKVYQISIEMSQAQQALDAGVKSLADFKTKAAAANQELKESKAQYQENAAELKQLVAQQKQLEAAKSKASAGAPAVQANAALDKNLKEQKLLNSIVQESKIDYQDAKAAAEAAGAAVGEQAAAVKELQGSVKGYGAAAAAAALEFGPGTVGALRKEVEQLKIDLDNAAVGSAEAATALATLASKQSQIRELNNQMNALNPRAQGRAFTVFSQAAVAGFTAASSAAEVFGLSSENAQKAQAKIQGLVAILYSVEQISKAASGENIALAKSILTSGKAYLAAGEAASTGAKITRAALLSTGILAVIALVGTLVSLWVEFSGTVSSSESTFTRFRATVTGGFDAMLAAGKDLLQLFGAFATYDFSAFKRTWQSIGKDTAEAYANGRAGVIADAHRAEIAAQIEQQARMIEVLKAAGKDTESLEIENAARKAANLKRSTDEEKKAYAEAIRDVNVLGAAAQKRFDEEELASKNAHLNALAAIQAAKGKDAYEQQRATKLAQINDLYDAEIEGERVSQAQKIQLQGEYDALEEAHEKELAEKRRALLSARLAARLSNIQAYGTDALKLITTQAADQNAVAIKANAAELALARQNRANLLAAAQIDRAAVAAADAEVYKLSLDRQRLFAQQQVQAVVESAALQKRVREAVLDSALQREKRYQADLNAAQQAGARVTQRVADELAAELERKRIKAESDADVGGRLLIKLFGLTDEEAQRTKEQIANFADQAGALVGNLMSIAQDAADQRLAETQAQLQAATDQYNTLSKSLADDEKSLGDSVGAKRDYLLTKIAKERAETEKLAGVKAAAARAEAAAEKEKQKLTKETTQLNQAATLASTVATGAKSVEAAVGVIAGGSTLPFPANIFAIGAGLAVVVSALASARALGKSLGDGGIIEGGSHASGNDVPVLGGRYFVEGGEAITPVDATEKNGDVLELIRTRGRTKKLTLSDFAEISRTRVAPPPTTGQYANGGILSKPSAPAGAVGLGQVVVQAADLSALVNNTSAMLTHLQAINGATAASAAKPPLVIGPYEAQQIDLEKQKADQAQYHATL